MTTTSDGMAPNNTNPDNNNIENFGNSKRLRLDGGVESGSPLTPPSFKENNNKSGESLLSQALAEKPAMLNFMSNNGGGRSDGHDDSGASDTGSERPESMLDGSMKTESNQMPSFDLHRYVFMSRGHVLVFHRIVSCTTVGRKAKRKPGGFRSLDHDINHNFLKLFLTF